LAGRTLTVSWVHGDFTPGNILVTPDGTSVTGIIDWDHSASKELPQLDFGASVAVYAYSGTTPGTGRYYSRATDR